MGTPTTTNITQSTFGDYATIVGSVTNVLSGDLLPTVGDATYDSFAERHNATCLANTRTDLLHQIQEWFKSSTGESIFWLNGMAGTGKSTIARTVARWLHEIEDGSTRLNTNFFFKKGKGDCAHARLFFTTIASQLATLDSDLGSLIDSVTKADPGIKNKSLKVQFKKLIKQPLRDVQKPMIITMVVDAMDESNERDDAKLIIDLLPRLRKIPSLTIRAFLTSRPELPIRLGFKELTCKYQEISLQEISQFVIEQDLETFFIHALGKIREKENKICLSDAKLKSNWPGPENIGLLVRMASPLFIFASTVCRFIDSNSISPEKQLFKVLEYQHATQLEAVYAPILNQLLSDVTETDQMGVVEGFRKVVGSVVSLQEPLSANSLSALLEVPRPDIDQILRQLHSVLAVPSDPDAPIEVLHKSFSDYLLSTGESGQKPHQFWVDSGESHERIASRCIEILESSLTPLFLEEIRNGVLDLQYFLPHVQYAYQYWVYHLKHANSAPRIEGQVHTFLKNHFLYWFEARILIDKTWVFGMGGTLETLAYKSGMDPRLFLTDAQQFVLAHVENCKNRRSRSNLIYFGLAGKLDMAILRTDAAGLTPQPVTSIPASPIWDPGL